MPGDNAAASARRAKRAISLRSPRAEEGRPYTCVCVCVEASGDAGGVYGCIYRYYCSLPVESYNCYM